MHRSIPLLLAVLLLGVATVAAEEVGNNTTGPPRDGDYGGTQATSGGGMGLTTIVLVLILVAVIAVVALAMAPRNPS